MQGFVSLLTSNTLLPSNRKPGRRHARAFLEEVISQKIQYQRDSEYHDRCPPIRLPMVEYPAFLHAMHHRQSTIKSL